MHAVIILMVLVAGLSGGPNHLRHCKKTQSAKQVAAFSFSGKTPGKYPSPVAADKGPSIELSRASDAYFGDTPDTIASAPANNLRVGYARDGTVVGAIAEPGVVSYALFSGTTCNPAAWVLGGTGTRTTGFATGPDNTASWTKLEATTPGVAVDCYLPGIPGGVPADTVITASQDCQAGDQPGCGMALLLPGSPITLCTCSTDDGTACTPTQTGGFCFGTVTTLSAIKPTRLTINTKSSSAGDWYSLTYSGGTTITGGYVGAGYSLVGLFMVSLNPYDTQYVNVAGASAARTDETATIPAVSTIFTKGSGTTVVRPEFTSANAGSNRYAFDTDNGDVRVRWTSSTSSWTATIGGVDVSTAPQTFVAGSPHVLKFRWGVGSNACIKVNSDSEVCTGTVAALSPTTVYLWGSTTQGFGGAFRDTALCPWNGVCTP